jgi:hypothetical protein
MAMLLSRTLRPAGIAAFKPAALAPATARWHCQVPCGIFDDPARVSELKEDAATIRKAMVQIGELSAEATPLALNQATRWVLTKEEHASSTIKTVAEYMLAQRVKPELFEETGEYKEALVAHHAVMQAAVKCKQVVDTSAADALDAAIEELAPMYN